MPNHEKPIWQAPIPQPPRPRELRESMPLPDLTPEQRQKLQEIFGKFKKRFHDRAFTPQQLEISPKSESKANAFFRKITGKDVKPSSDQEKE